LAALCGAELEGDPRLEIRGPASLEAAEEHDVSYFGHARYAKVLSATRAGALVVPTAFRRPDGDSGAAPTLLRCADPNAAFAQIFAAYGRLPERPAPGAHPTAVIGANVRLGADVSIGAYCVIGDGAELGDRVVLHPHVVLGPRVRIGADTEIRSHVACYDGVRVGARGLIHAGVVIGGDGFGFDPVAGPKGVARWDKIAHGGSVEIGDDVEIGANSTIDRGRFEATRIGDGVKIDNLVHVAHNVQVGANALLIAQVGVAGSVRIGEGAILAGQCGVAPQLSVGANARIGPASAVFENLASGEDYMGYWAQPRREWMRQTAQLRRLGDMIDRVRALEKEVAALKEERP